MASTIGGSGITVLGRRKPRKDATCPWCDVLVTKHEPPVEQRIFGFNVLICAYAPIGEITGIGMAQESPADG
jgi:hypothetical protein